MIQVSQAQVGSGWTQQTFSERLEYETNDILKTISPPPSSFNNGYCEYDNTNGVETFQLLDPYSNRIEIRPNDDYSSGSRQFQADVLISQPSADECIHQIFNGSTAPYLLLREETNNNGSLKVALHSGGGASNLATNLYGVWFRLNSINDMNSGYTYLYVNGSLVWSGPNPGGTFYTKYGCYGTHTVSAKIQFKNAMLFSGGNTNSAADFSLSASPASQPVPVGSNTSYTVSVSALGGFSGNVTLSVSGLPTGASANFNPTSISGSGSSTLSVTTTTNTTANTYTLTITGTSGSLAHSNTVALALNDFSISVTPSSQTVTAGNAATNTVTVGNINGFVGTVSLSASGLPSGASANFNPASINMIGSSTLTVATATNTPPGTNTLTITGASGSLAHSSTVTLTVNAAGGGLPGGWTDQDIGAVGVAGSASYNAGVFTLNGSGTDIWGTGDQFNYAYESTTNDFTVIARVASLSSSNAWSKSGVMIRETTATNSTYIGIYVTVGNGVSLQCRPSTGASAVDLVRQTNAVAPYWVRLTRSGNTLTGFSSPDGLTWTQVGTTNLTMVGTVTAGLVACAHNNTQLNTSTFDNVAIVGTVAAPSFSPAGGTYTNSQSVTISTTTTGASIRYTTDGSTPSETAGALYSSPVNISVNTMLKAIAYESGYTDSAVTSATYSIQVAAPAFSPGGGTYTSVQTVTITSSTGGASIRYTTDGSTPTSTTGTLYSSPVTVNTNTTLNAIAYESGMTNSSVTSASYTINLPQVAAPTFSPGGGTYTNAQSVTIGTTTTGALIRYTTDGSTPSETAGMLYSSPVNIGANTTLKAVAYETGYIDSSVTSATYTISGLPSGWTDADIGSPGVSGSASYSSGIFTVSGSGADIWNAGDQFNFAYQSATNDLTITARVVSESANGSYAKAGVMIRETTATNSIEASVLLTPTNGVAMEVRPTAGAATINVSGWVKGLMPPAWVKLVRAGNTFTGYSSSDGSTWTQVATTNVTMASSATAGLAVCAHDNTTLNTATIDNVSVSSTPTPAKLSIPASAVTASSTYGTYWPSNTVDGSLSTRWTSSGDGQWIQYDLGASKTVSYLKLAFYAGDSRIYTNDVQVATTTNGTWTTVINRQASSGTTTNLTTYDFTDTPGRYVRVVGHIGNHDSYNNITETEVWGY